MSSIRIEQTPAGARVQIPLGGAVHALTPCRARDLARRILAAVARHEGREFLRRHQQKSPCRMASAPTESPENRTKPAI